MSPVIWVFNKKETTHQIDCKTSNFNDNLRDKNSLQIKRTNLIKSQNTKNERNYKLLKSLNKKLNIISPRIRDINSIDKYSRLIFPSLFLIFNFFYWLFYLL